MERGKEVLEALRAHRLAREDKVLRSLRAVGGASLDALTPLVYDDVPADRHSWARLTLEAHLIKLVREGRVGERNGIWRLSRRMKARLAISLHAVERAARRQVGVARHHAGSCGPASAGHCSATMAPARRSCSNS